MSGTSSASGPSTRHGASVVGSRSRPARCLVTWRSVPAPRTSAPGTADPSAAAAAGTMTSDAPASRAAETSATMPGTDRRVPSRASSPISATRSRPCASSCPDATRIPTAMARSWPVPSLGRSAGARLTVIRRAGTSKSELRRAARTRSRASSTALPARPTIVRPGSPKETSTSTRTGTPSTPTIDALSVVASIGQPRRRRGRAWRQCRSPACSPPYYQRRPAQPRLGTAGLPPG